MSLFPFELRTEESGSREECPDEAVSGRERDATKVSNSNKGFFALLTPVSFIIERKRKNRM